MAVWLRQSTSVDIRLGPFLDETDGKTAETALTLTQPDIRLKKNNGNWAQKNAAQTLTHEENGWYELTLDTTDTGTLGLLTVAVHESGALPVWFDALVVPANVWDSFFASDLLQVDAQQWLGGTIATPTVTGVPEVDITHFNGSAGTFSSGRPEVNTTHVGGTSQTAGDIIGDTNDIQARLPAALVSGRIDASVGAMAANTVTASAIATAAIDADSIASDAITAAKLASDAGTEIAAAVLAAVAESQGSYTVAQCLSIMLSALAGVTSSNGSVLKTPNGSATRITATIDSNNNRTAMSLSP